MDAAQINSTFDLYAVVSSAVPLKRQGAYYVGPCPLCGGRDRFNLRRGNKGGWVWICRQCGNGKYQGAIDYVMAERKLHFLDALHEMGGEVKIRQPRAELTAPRTRVNSSLETNGSDWQAKAWHMVYTAAANLDSNEIVRKIIRQRGISLATQYAYLLGTAKVYDVVDRSTRPAIILPWWDCDDGQDVIVAVKYRYCDQLARDHRRRYGGMGGNKQILFGLHLCAGANTLMLVEGEFNAMSVYQVAANTMPCLDVASIGSQAATNIEILRALAIRYQRIIVWTDEIEKGRALARDLPHARAISSPVIGEEKYDANRLLTEGQLPDYLKGVC